MQRLVEVAEYGPPGGIDQSERPTRNSVRDARNLDSSGVAWKVRPGRRFIPGLSFDSLSTYPLDTSVPIVLALEFVPDKRFSQDYGYSVIIAGKRPSADTLRFLSLDIARKSVSVLTYYLGAGAESDYISSFFSVAKGLYRYKVNGSVSYQSGYIITNGMNSPGFVHASKELSDVESGSPSFRIIPADAKDGGDSDITYLEQTPKGKTCVIHKSRLFMLNTPDGANRAYFTGPDSNGVFTVNVWPSLYNFDIGDPTPITGAVSFRDNLLVLKEREMWLVGGDGVGGVWALQKVFDGAGALSQQLVADVGDSVVFANRDGVYRWAGGAPSRISDKINKVWARIGPSLSADVNTADQSLPRIVYDKQKRRVLIHCGGNTDASEAGYLVYNLDRDTWDIWHMLPDEYRVFGFYTDNMVDAVLLALENYEPGKTRLMSFSNGYSYFYVDDNPYDEKNTSGGLQYQPIPFWFETQDIGGGDSQSKLFRQATIEANNQSAYSGLQIVPCVDSMPMETARLSKIANRYVIDKYIGYDATYGYQYSINGKISDGSPFSAGDYVRVLDLFTGYAYATIRIQSVPTASDSWIGLQYDLSSYVINMSSKYGMIVIVSEDDYNEYLNQRTINIDNPDYYFSSFGYGGTWGEMLFVNPRQKKMIFPLNGVGKKLRLFVSNFSQFLYEGGKSDLRTEIAGWSLMYSPRRVYRSEY